MINILDLSDITDFASFIWSIISTIVDTIVDVVNLIKDLILFIPKFLTIFPKEITMLLIPTITVIIFVSIYKFVK